MWEDLARVDPEIFAAMKAELLRQHRQLEMIASENHVSPAVLEAAGTVLTNKYAEGYPAKRYYNGCEHVDVCEKLALERVKKLFKAEHANVQPHSGTQANMAVYFALLQPGDTILGLDLAAGGHLSHGFKLNFSGKQYLVAHYGVHPETERIDFEQLRKLALEARPKLIVAGASAYPRILEFDKFSAVAREVGAYLLVDMAHIAGLVAAGLHPDPFPWAEVVTSTTHKTLRGPRGGLILCKKDLAKKIDSNVFPGTQGGPLMHIIAAKAVAFQEALQPSFQDYQRQIVKNASALAKALCDRGFRLVSGGTDNHLLLLDLRSRKITGKAASNLLEKIGITVNKNLIPNDPLPPAEASGLRIGTPAVTTRGLKEPEMIRLAEIMDRALSNAADEALHARLRKETMELCETHALYNEQRRALGLP